MRSRGSRALAAVAAVLATAVAVALPAAAAEPQWNVARVGGPASARGVLVAVVDTGVDAAHPALAGRVEPAIDLVGGGGGDPNGHGTHVAGTVAGADTDPGCGVIGVAPDARVLPVRVLDEEGEGTVDAVARGIRQAADAGAAVINLSLGTDVVLRNVSGSGLREAIEYAWGKGSIPVLAAGNDGLLGGVFGSGYGGLPAVVVTATDHRDQVAPYATSIGSAEWGIAAPGGDRSGEAGRDVLSSYPGRRCALSAGTSMSAPHVSGALAALRAAGYDPRAAVQRVLSTAKDLGAAGPDGTYGHGLLDLRAALGRTPPTTTVATTAAPAPAPAGPESPTTTARGASRPSPSPATTAVTDGQAGGSTTSTTDPGAPTVAGDGGPTTSSTSSTTDRDDGGGEAAAADEADDDGAPATVVVLAVAALGIAGAASGVAARRFGRGVSGSGRRQP